MNLGSSTPTTASPRWHTEWLRLTSIGAIVVTATDAALLERKKGFFTGGFLAVDHLRSPLEALLFLGASILSDAAVICVLVAAALSVSARLRLTRMARSLAVLAIAISPMATANFISYQLHLYLGDAFNLGLMFDLTGRRPEELFAVASSHLGGPLALLTSGSICTFGVVWAVNRFIPGERALLPKAGGRRIWQWPLALFLLGLFSTAILRAGTDVMENGLRRKPSGKFLGAIAERASDIDRDGFGAIARLNDPDPFNANVFPYAVEIPGNGVDENGVGGDLAAGVPQYREAGQMAAKWAFRPNIILIVLESFRADVLGTIHNGRPVTPTLNELAAKGISSQLAFSHNGYTAQSRYHIFSGSLAGLRGGTTLIDDFQANGYEVAYFSGQDESFGGEEFAIGFERANVRYDARSEPHRRYSTFSTAGSLAVPHNVVTEHVDRFLAARSREKPLLLYVNFHDTHFPYHHDGIEPLVSNAALERRDISPQRRDALRETYLNTVANVDRAVAAVLSSARHALGQNPAVIITADHGESLYEEGFLGHGYALNDVQTRIPLIVSGLPLRLVEPVGQAEVRDSLRAALAETPDPNESPLLLRDDGKLVFQYLGTIRRPRQIGFVAGDGSRTIYDFTERRARIRGDRWRDPHELTGTDRLAFLDLVHFWEQITVARNSE